MEIGLNFQKLDVRTIGHISALETSTYMFFYTQNTMKNIDV